MKLVYYIIISAMFCSSSLFSQNFWQRLNGISAANYIQSLAIHPTDGTLYAGTPNGGGVFKSSNDGESWTMISNGLPINQSISAIAVASNGSLFCASDKLYQSTDNGGTWSSLPNSPEAPSTITIASNGNLYVGTGSLKSGVHRSNDGGTSWTQISNGLPTFTYAGFTFYRGIKSIAIASDGSLLCSVNDGNTTEQGIYRSTDDGANWTKITSGLRITTPYGVLMNGTNNVLYLGIKNNIFRSSDNGVNWTICDSIPVSSSTYVSAFVTANGNLYAGMGGNGVYKANLDGQGWANASTDPGILNGLNGTSLVANASGTLFYGAFEFYNLYAGVFRSLDSGKTWTQKNTGISNYPVFGIATNNLGYVFVGAGRGRYDRSTDGGVTFEQGSLPITGPSYLTIINAVGTNSNGAVAFGTTSGIYSSTDNGTTWAKTSSETGTKVIVSRPNGDLYAGTGSGILRSSDNGQTWTTFSSHAPVHSILFTSGGSILTGSYNTGIWRSTNNGVNWTSSGTSQTGAVTIFGAVQHPNGTIYMNNLGTCLRSTDDGVTWTTVSLGWFQQLWCFTIAGSTLMFGTPDGLYKSTDNGGTWTNHKDGLMWTQVGYLAADANGYVFAGTQSGLYKSSQPVNAVKELNDAIPSSYSLEQNYPNPFNPTTKFEFRITNREFVLVKVFDVLGREVATLVNEELHPGTYQTEWNAEGKASGVYIYRLTAGEFTETRRMVLIR